MKVAYAFQYLLDNGIDGDMARGVFKTIKITKVFLFYQTMLIHVPYTHHITQA
jgi:hypothetical protein